MIKGLIIRNTKTGNITVLAQPMTIEEACNIRDFSLLNDDNEVYFGSEITVLQGPKINVNQVTEDVVTIISDKKKVA